jgi:alkylation response protein AidB-like acyl-CoA dehydrogenase
MKEELSKQILNTVKQFIKTDVAPVVKNLEDKDIYPNELADKMAELGLFGINISQEHGGLGLNYTTLAQIFTELSRGWMSLAGILGTHTLACYMIQNYGTDNQKKVYLPKLATGEMRAGLGLTESHSGSDVQNIKTFAKKKSEGYEINGSKMFITNGSQGNLFILISKTNLNSDPKYKGISCFIIEGTDKGFSVGQKLDKLGYRGVDTCELLFEDCEIPLTRLLGEVEGNGFRQVMDGLETGRINVAARSVGVAKEALKLSIDYSRKRETFDKPIKDHQMIQSMIATMATKIKAAELLVNDAAELKDNGLRVDLESGMAKLFASEICQEVCLDAMRIHGGYGYTKDLPIERFYRDSPLMIIGEGTNEIMKLLIAKRVYETNF